MKRLTVVIVNYNSKDYLQACLESLYQQTTNLPFQVVVVDNASDDRDFRHLHNLYPDLLLLCNTRNLGFATACNQGIRRAPAPYYLFLNPDCVVLDRAVERCMDWLEPRQEIGILGCRVCNPDGSLQRACRRSIPTPASALFRITGLSRLFPGSRRLGRYNLSYLSESESHPVEAVSGSFMLFRQQVVDSIGLMDEQFFLYGEDLDFCYRALQRGWKVYYYSGAQVIHHKRRSSARNSRASNFHYYNAMELFYRKHYLAGAGALERWLVLRSIRSLYGLKRLRQKLGGSREVGSRG